MNAAGLAPTEPSLARSDLIQLQRELGRVLGTGIGISCSGVDGDPDRLWPIEREAVQKAIPRRQREFAAGRLAARDAMACIGLPPQAIPCAPDRSPVWPEGVTGSIAHNQSVCVAIVGRRDEVHALGIDIEQDCPMEAALWPTICTREELATLDLLSPAARGHWVTRVFCAKEAYYKWQYPQTGRLLDFCDVRVAFNREHSGFQIWRAEIGNGWAPSSVGQGRVCQIDGLLVAVLVGHPPAGLPDR